MGGAAGAADSSTGMACQAVIAEIIDFSMLFLHLGLVMLMTAKAGVGVVVIVGMTELALLVGPAVIQRERVTKTRWFPGIRIMAGRTLAAEMIRGLVPAVAGNAVRCPCRAVIEGRRQPGTRAVAGRTLPRIMVRRLVAVMARIIVIQPARNVRLSSLRLTLRRIFPIPKSVMTPKNEIVYTPARDSRLAFVTSKIEEQSRKKLMMIR